MGTTGGASSVALSNDNLPSHCHAFTPTGSVGSHSHDIDTYHRHSVSGTTSVESAHESFSWSGPHHHGIYANITDTIWDTTVGANDRHASGIVFSGTGSAPAKSAWVDTNKHSGENPIIQNTTISVSGTCTGDHTHTFSEYTSYEGSSSKTSSSVQPSFTGSRTDTEYTGNTAAFSIMPPYECAICWKRVS